MRRCSTTQQITTHSTGRYHTQRVFPKDDQLDLTAGTAYAVSLLGVVSREYYRRRVTAAGL
jgi:hypothetical protein